jgi:DNA-binding transcriptional LysR family regulator
MKGARYDLFSMLIEAALAGLGVALAPQLYVAEDIANGRLLAPWPVGRSSGKCFVLLMPPEKRENALLSTFADWLMQEAAR